MSNELSYNPHRRKESASFVESVAILEGPDERLLHVENVLADRLRALVKRRSPEAPLYFELDLTAEEYSWLTAELSAYFGKRRPLHKLLNSYPRIVIGALVSAAMQSTREGTVWPTFWELMGTESQQEFEREIRKNIRAILSKVSLNNFVAAELGANEYVSLFLLHAGVTASQIVDIVNYSNKMSWSVQTDDVTKRVEALTAAVRTPELDRESMREFVTYAPNMASELYERILELIPYISNSHFDPAAFLGTNGIPSLAFNALIDLLENGRVVPVSIRQKQPSIEFLPASNSFVLEIPALVSRESTDATEWEITTKNLSGDISTRYVPVVFGRQQAQQITISEPFEKITVDRDDSEWEKRDFIGVTPDFPYLLVSRSNRLQPSTGGIKAAFYTFVAPAGIAVKNQDGEDVTCSSRAVHADWQDWETRSIDLRKASSLRIEQKGIEPIVAPVGSAKLFEWITTARTLDNALGRDSQPIFVESPRLRLSGEPGDVWNIEVVYDPIDAEPEFVMDFDIEQVERIESHDIFPSDQFDDPWVGRFNVTLTRNGVFQDSMLVSIVEGIELRSSTDGPTGFGFRFQDNQGKFTKWYYSLRSNSGKPLNYSSGTRTIGVDSASAEEVFSTDEGYSLEADVLPESLSIRYKHQSGEPVKVISAPSIVVDQLDPESAVIVTAPQELPLAKFVIAAPLSTSQGINNLEQADYGMNSRSTVRVTNRALDSGLGDKSSGKLLLVWSRLTRSAYENSLSKSAKRRYFKLPWAKKSEEYFAAAQESLVSATVADLIRQPLVRSVEEVDKELRVMQPLGANKDLMAWAWSLGRPSEEPVTLRKGPNGFFIPPELDLAGPLIVDFREETFLCDTRSPEAPTRRAFTIDREGVPMGESHSSVALYQVGLVERVEHNEQNLIELWKNLYSLRKASQRRGCDRAFGRASVALKQSARDAMDVVTNDQIPRAGIASLLILSGILLESFQTESTLAEPHPDRMISLLEEIADAAYLKLTQPDGEELQHSLRWVALNGSSELWKTLTMGKDFVTKAESNTERKVAVEEALNANESLLRLGTVTSLYSASRKIVGLLSQSGIGGSAIHMAAELDEQAREDSDPAHSVSRFVPYISYVMMNALRVVANGEGVERWAERILKHQLTPLSQIAQRAPKLFELDLVTAEALSLSTAFVKP
ncbi:hypothetical protein ACOI93_08075 [Corynebacterium striatum]|uniref:hypothetical protein n=1 Tax=Corynebacterium striatum TaxID=43770 RepID=UPI001FC8C2EF|nr:hypothetical protein [Corynebacterium striatum]GKH16397.1 hypothetical protein CE91St29_07100 [Corynebacterium striatum]HCD1553410.1 hypothetical protein [Corynebacterium striatum]HCD1824866.1 hypothetical protein [Corynebacterium striatum]HCD2181532.1 hypothetical protein [Corynebacterium striatum]HCD2851898.1 hypothetical protein [Corynebacterium striatum]